ncbi:MAG: lamin tail domain-containing protein [Candidatus Peribacteraceae bacterium]|nr:lamin tail domain-containing protein [Candidatus Peribacteraceae bacterium]
MRKFIFGIVIVLSAATAVVRASDVRSIVINEIAWMGTLSSSYDEWIELANPTDSDIEISGWILSAEDGSPLIELVGTIAANSFFLLERTDDTTVDDIIADQIYTGTLGNDGEVLILSDPEGNEIDRIDAWHAGDNAAKISMERIDPAIDGIDPANWTNNDGVTFSGLDAEDNPLTGTPRSKNSVYVVTSEPEPEIDPEPEPEPEIENLPPATPSELAPISATDSKTLAAKYSDPEEEMGWIEFRIFTDSPDVCGSEDYLFSEVSELVGNNATATKEFPELPDGEYFWCARAFDGDNYSDFSEIVTFVLDTTVESLVAEAESRELLLNEIAWAGSTDSSADEWIELHNITRDKIFLLDGWKIITADESLEIILSGEIPPGEFFLLERTDDDSAPDVPADQVYTGGLSNSGEILILLDAAGSEIDRIDGSDAWSLGGDSDSRQTLARVDTENFSTSFEADGTPRAANFFDHDLALAEISAEPSSVLPGGTATFSVNLENRGLNVEDFDLVWKINGSEISRETITELATFSQIAKTFSQSFEVGNYAVNAEIELSTDENLANNSSSIELDVENHLVINEFVPAPAGSDSENEWIELFNPSENPIDLTGYNLNGVQISGEIAATGFLVFTAVDFPDWSALVSTSGEVVLNNPEGGVVDSKAYANATEGKSFGRLAENLSEWMEFWHPTPGTENTESNADPVANITIQGSGKTSGECSLYVNLAAEDSSDPDGDELEFEWDFGDGTNSDEENPSGFYFAPGAYEVSLLTRDALGATSEVKQIFQISQCSNGSGGSINARTSADEPVFDSWPVDQVELKINEVAFNSSPDWIEIFVMDDGNDGRGVELGGFYFEADKRIKTIPRNTFLKTGAFLLLEFKSENPTVIERGDGFTKIFSDRSGLTATDEQLTLRDSNGVIEDAVVWENRDGKWSRGEEADIQELVDKQAWISTDFADALDSSQVSRGSVIVRDPENPDSNSAVDWFVTAFATPGLQNHPADFEPPELEAIATMTGDIRISEIMPNPRGKDAGVEWFELVNLGETPIELFGWKILTGSKEFEFTESIILGSQEYRAFPGLLTLRNSGDLLKLIDPNGIAVDSVEFPKISEGSTFAKNLSEEFYETVIPTPGAANSFYKILKADEDTDGDGLTDLEELEKQTDPQNFDSDGDGLPDFFEIQNGSDPIQPDADAEKLKSYRTTLAALTNSQLESSVDSQKISLSGIGVPGGCMRVYIQSELEVIEVPVSRNGNWNYTLDRELQQGEHHIFTQLIDPHGLEGVAQKVLNFSLADKFIPQVQTSVSKSATSPKQNSNYTQYTNGNLSDAIRISEILANPVGNDAAEEFIEIENFGTASVNLGNWELSDNKKSFLIPNTVILRPGEFKVFPRSLTKLALNNSGYEKVQLKDFIGQIVAEFDFESPVEGVGLAFDGENIRMSRFITPGEQNKFDTQKFSGSVKINSNFFEISGQKIYFGEGSSALLARVLFRNGNDYRVFVKPENGELKLSAFEAVPEFLEANMFTLNQENYTANLKWLFLALLALSALIASSFARFKDFLNPLKSS